VGGRVTERRILIVDNDQTLRHELSRALRDVEIVSDSVSDAAEAIALLLQQRYAIVILDVAIAGGSDAVIAAAQRISEGERPIVIVTADAENIGGLDAEAVQVVMRRPVRVREVAELARACIDARAARRRTDPDEVRVF
jgi:DNA-binding response OmpR family regulator